MILDISNSWSWTRLSRIEKLNVYAVHQTDLLHITSIICIKLMSTKSKLYSPQTATRAMPLLLNLLTILSSLKCFNYFTSSKCNNQLYFLAGFRQKTAVNFDLTFVNRHGTRIVFSFDYIHSLWKINHF